MDIQNFSRWRVVANALSLNESLCDDMNRGEGWERRERRMLVIVPWRRLQSVSRTNNELNLQASRLIDVLFDE